MAITEFNIDKKLIYLISSNSSSKINVGETWTTTLTSYNKYKLPEDILVINADYAYNKNTGELVISNAIDDVIIQATGLYEEPNSLITYEDLEAFKNKVVSIILNYKSGYYDKNEAYSVDDIVFYQKKIYVCIQATSGGISPLNTSYWLPLVL